MDDTLITWAIAAGVAAFFLLLEVGSVLLFDKQTGECTPCAKQD